MGRSTLFLDSARWSTLLAFGLATAMYGGVRPWARDVLAALLMVNLGLFAVGLAMRRRWPRVPIALAGSTLILCALGWFMAANAKTQFVAVAGVWIERVQMLPGWAGSVDKALTVHALVLWTGLWGASWIICDAAAHGIWRRRIWGGFVVFGTAFVLLGLWQRLAGAPSIYWEEGPRAGGTFFGTFRYHANAGAFLNVVLPFCVAMAVWAFRPRGGSGWRVAGVLCSVLVATGGLVNVSRAANVLLIVLLAGMVFVFRSRSQERRWTVGVVLFSGAVVVLALCAGLEGTASRWETAWRQATVQGDARLQTWATIVQHLLPSAGLWGSGAGTFEPVFQTLQLVSGPAGRWDHAHSDPLQVLVEWGWGGAAAWAIFFGGALIRVIFYAWRHGRGEGRLFAGACGLSMGALLLHSCADFPLQIPALQLAVATIAGACYGLRVEGPEKMISHHGGGD